ELARVRLRQIKEQDDPPQYALLDRVPPIESNAKVTEEEAPSDNLRVQKAELLENGALVEFAVKELQAAAEEEKGNWLPAANVRFYQDAGRFDMAIET